MSSRTRFIAAVISSLALSFALAPDALAKKVVVGPVSVEVPDDFKDVAGTTPAVHQDSSGITVEASALPPEALHEFKGQPFLDYLQSLGFTNPVYADGALKR
ncbi:MAG TPA: hypothetical protein PKE16_07390, partial [Hyphomicrobium sp.]|nr:hypothetical protein [Hyphomicrobium sp.]